MKTNEILYEIQRLPIQKRIYVLEKALNSIRIQESKNQFEKAVDLLQNDYLNDKDLTAFSSLDFEDFYETK